LLASGLSSGVASAVLNCNNYIRVSEVISATI